MNYEIGYVFTDDNDYSNVADWCNHNNAMIEEIDSIQVDVEKQRVKKMIKVVDVPAVEAVEEVYHKDENGEIIIDTYAQNAGEEVSHIEPVYETYTEKETRRQFQIAEIQPYVPTTEDRINELKSQLTRTDYQAIKFSEGQISEEDYAPIRAARQALREQINELENK